MKAGTRLWRFFADVEKCSEALSCVRRNSKVSAKICTHAVLLQSLVLHTTNSLKFRARFGFRRMQDKALKQNCTHADLGENLQTSQYAGQGFEAIFHICKNLQSLVPALMIFGRDLCASDFAPKPCPAYEKNLKNARNFAKYWKRKLERLRR